MHDGRSAWLDQSVDHDLKDVKGLWIILESDHDIALSMTQRLKSYLLAEFVDQRAYNLRVR